MEKEDKLLDLVEKRYLSLNNGETIKVYVRGLPEYNSYEIIVYDVPVGSLNSKFYNRLHKDFHNSYPLYLQQSVWAVPKENVDPLKRYILGCGGVVFSLKLVKEEEWEEALKGNVNHTIDRYLRILRTLQDMRGSKKIDLYEVSTKLYKIAEIDKKLFYEPLVDEIRSIRSRVLAIAKDLIDEYSISRTRTEAEGR